MEKPPNEKIAKMKKKLLMQTIETNRGSSPKCDTRNGGDLDVVIWNNDPTSTVFPWS